MAISVQDFLKQKNSSAPESAPSAISPADFLANRTATPTAPPQKQGFFVTAKDFLKNIPTALARTVTQPVEFVERAGTTLGDIAAKKANLNIPVSPKVSAATQAAKTGLEKPITAPFQSEPLIEAKPFKTPLQAVGSAGEAALNIGLGIGLGPEGIAAKDLVLSAIKQGATKEVKQQAAKTLLATLVKHAIPGAAYGLTATLEDQNPTFKKAAANIVGGAATSILLPPVLGKATEAGMRVAGAGSRVIGEGVERAASALEKHAQPAETMPELYYQKAITPQSTSQKLAEKAASTLRYAQTVPARLETALVDKRAGVKRFEQQANAAGIQTGDLQELVAGTGARALGRAEQNLDSYINLKSKYGTDWDNVKLYSHYLDDIDRLSLGQTIPGGRSLKEVNDDLQKLFSHLTEEQQKKMAAGQQELQQFYDSQLREAVNEGRLSQEGYDKIKQDHPNYIRHDVLDFQEEKPPAFARSGSMNVAKSGIEKAKGSARQIDDIDTAMVRLLLKNANISEKNKALSEIIGVGKQMEGFTPLRTADKVEQRNALLDELSQSRAELQRIKDSTSMTNKEDRALVARIDSLQKEMDALSQEGIDTFLEHEPAVAKKLQQVISVRSKEIPGGTQYTSRSQNVGPTPGQAARAIVQKDVNKGINQKLDTRDILMQNILGEKAATEHKLGMLSENFAKKKEQIRQTYAEARQLHDINMKKVDIPKGYEKLSHFVRGIREDWLVPEDLGRVLKNLDGQEVGAVMRWLDNSFIGKALQIPAKALRAISTSKNPIFALFTNPARDVQTAAMTEKISPLNYAKGLINIITGGKPDPELYDLAKVSGALQGSIYRENLTPEQILQKKMWDATKKDRKFTEKVSSFAKSAATFRWVEDVGQKFEELTRMNVFRTALEGGATPEQAAKAARNATVDFGKSGTLVQVVNKLVPFLNARVQGLSNMVGALKKNPTQFYRNLMWSSAYPTALLYAHNQQFSSYKDIPDFEKQKYWIVMVGQDRGKDATGQTKMLPHYVKIPKGEAQQLLSSVLERVLNKGKEKYPDSTGHFLGQLLQNISPVTESSILPAGFGQALETKMNYSLFRGRPIVSDYVYPTGNKAYKASEIEPRYQFNEGSTSALAKQLGNALNWSPAKIDYIIKQGILTDFLRIYDIPFQKKKKATGTFDTAAQLPFARTILGNASYGEDLKKKAAETQKQIEKNSKALRRKIK